jgi:hypothetical protein
VNADAICYAADEVAKESANDSLKLAVIQGIKNLMNRMHSIDIVRCNECKHGFRTNFIKEPYLMCEQWSDDGNVRTVKPDDFCSYGEREGE